MRGQAGSAFVRLSSSNIERIWAAILALIFGYFFVVARAEDAWRSYWLLKDGQQGTAIVIKELWSGHGVVAYRYRVGDKDYIGEDARSWQNPKYAHAMAGEPTVVYFSSSHPRLSLINRPRTAMPEGLPVLALAWLLEAGLVITAINPRNKWSLSFDKPLFSGK